MTEGHSNKEQWIPLRDTQYTTEDLLNNIASQHAKQHTMVAQKNADYAGSHNPFENFMRTAETTGISVDQAFLFHIVNKVSRLKNLSMKDGPAVVSEPITDSLDDLANYANLWLAYRNWYSTQVGF